MFSLLCKHAPMTRKTRTKDRNSEYSTKLRQQISHRKNASKKRKRNEAMLAWDEIEDSPMLAWDQIQKRLERVCGDIQHEFF